MSKTSKKRFVTKHMEQNMILPTENDMVAQVIASRGSNLHEVEDAAGERYLASIPTKFRNTVWIKRGQFVLLQPIEEGDKVRAEIAHVLDTENILYIRDQGAWPLAFDAAAEAMTRQFKRGMAATGSVDPDLLPPSESSEESGDEEAESDSEDFRPQSDDDDLRPPDDESGDLQQPLSNEARPLRSAGSAELPEIGATATQK